MTGPLRNFFTAFRSEERGSIAVETILVFPLLMWAYLATFVFFDAFRQQTNTLKANYTISDMLSRETGYITPAYLDGLYRLHEFLTTSPHDTKFRVSVITYDASSDKYRVRWSVDRNNAGILTNANIDEIVPQLPIMPDKEIVVVVQNWAVYEPAFSIGLEAFTFSNLIVTRPRFAGQLCYNTLNTGGTSSTATC